MKAWLRLLMLASAALAMQALGQGYPNKPVHVIISFTPGSSTDIVGRIVAQKLADLWNQPVVPDNRAGAGGSIGSAIVAKAAADGYTLLINSNAHSVNPAIYAKLPYDTAKDFTDIAPLAMQPNVLVVNAGAPYKTVMDLVNAAKANPGAINWGHAGIGSGTHLNTEKFVAAANVKVTQIPFKGTPEVIQSMFSGSVDCYWVPISAGMSHIRSGKLRALAVSTAKRNPTLPDVPTTGEAGVKDADAPLWFGLWGPAGMPADLVNKINTDLRRALAAPGVKERLANLGNDTMDMSLQLLERKAFDHFDDVKPVGLHVDHREVGVDAVDAARACQRVGAALDDLAFAALGEVLHHHQHLLRAHREIHRAAHGGDRVRAAGVPVGKVAGRGHLERPQDAEIEVPAADHAEGIGMVEIRPAGKKRRRLLSGVDEVFVFFAGCWLRPDTKDAVLAVENDLAAFRQVVGDQSRQADPEVDVRPIGDVAGNPRRDLLLVELLHQAAFRIDGATRTTRLTKMPGVTIDSGSRTPSSTVSRTCTTAHLAALAMIGPKFRALLR